jgi:hypothetical protein
MGLGVRVDGRFSEEKKTLLEVEADNAIMKNAQSRKGGERGEILVAGLRSLVFGMRANGKDLVDKIEDGTVIRVKV